MRSPARTVAGRVNATTRASAGPASGARLFTYLGGTQVDAGNTVASAPTPDRPDLDAQPLLGAGERQGMYQVIVRKPGHADWVRGILVTGDRCHVKTVELTALLRPQG